MLAFSFTLPATKAAVIDLDAVVVGMGRAVPATFLAVVVLLATRSPLPGRALWAPLALTSLGVVVGFPLFTALALHYVSASHGAVIVGLLPAATAVFAVRLAGERPSPAFWLVCAVGLLCVLAFAASRGSGRPQLGDLFALAAVASAAVGYAQGAVLARKMGGWRVICWALIVALPVVVPVVTIAVLRTGLAARPSAWAGFLYVSIVSMFLAFFPWYRGLAIGGIARISQLQLVQPVLTFGWSVLLLGEHLEAATLLAAGAVVLCAALSQRTQVRLTPPPPSIPFPSSPVCSEGLTVKTI